MANESPPPAPQPLAGRGRWLAVIWVAAVVSVYLAVREAGLVVVP